MKVPDGYRTLLRVKGIDLAHLGLRELALGRADALNAVGLLRDADIAILGGDVYVQRPTGIETSHASWHADRAANEGRPTYSARSCREAESYIRSFPRTEDTALFVLVPDV